MGTVSLNIPTSGRLLEIFYNHLHLLHFIGLNEQIFTNVPSKVFNGA